MTSGQNAEHPRKTSRGRGESKRSPRRLKAARRQAQALELRIGGHTLQQIADDLGFAGRSGAMKAIDAAISAVRREPAEELIQVEYARLEAIHRRLWGRMMLELPGPDLCAVVGALLKVSARRAKLLGLDAQSKQQVTTDLGGLTPEEIEQKTIEVFKAEPDLWARIKAEVEG